MGMCISNTSAYYEIDSDNNNIKANCTLKHINNYISFSVIFTKCSNTFTLKSLITVKSS